MGEYLRQQQRGGAGGGGGGGGEWDALVLGWAKREIALVAVLIDALGLETAVKVRGCCGCCVV